MLPVIERDGKHFINADGKEQEIQLPKTLLVTGVQLKPAGKTEDEVTAMVTAATNKAEKDAIEKERKYHDAFDLILNSTGLTGKGAQEFRKFYGRSEEDLKFLATNAIGARAKAVGEGGGEPDDKGDAALVKVEKEAGERFDAELGIRRMFNVRTNDKDSQDYKTGRGRYVAASRKRHLDTQK